MDKPASPGTALADQATSQLRQEFEAQRSLFRAQPTIIQRFLEAQARQLVEAILQKSPQVHFKLPDRVILEATGKGSPSACAGSGQFPRADGWWLAGSRDSGRCARRVEPAPG